MSELLISRHDRILQLTLNRPQARNALNNTPLTQTADTLEGATAGVNVSACMISGNTRYFAAGADLSEMAEKDLPTTFDDIRPYLWVRIDAFNKSLTAVVSGYALGAGCELVLLYDLVIAGDNARSDLPEITLGTIPGAGGTQWLIRCVGKVLTSRMVLSGESIGAE